MYWFGWSFGTRTCKHVTGMERRKANGNLGNMTFCEQEIVLCTNHSVAVKLMCTKFANFRTLVTQPEYHIHYTFQS